VNCPSKYAAREVNKKKKKIPQFEPKEKKGRTGQKIGDVFEVENSGGITF